MNKEKLIKSVIKEAQKDLLKEYTLKQKTILTLLIKHLVTSGVDETEIKKITDFYSPDEGFQIEDELLYNEFKRKLLDLANSKNINISEKFKE